MQLLIRTKAGEFFFFVIRGANLRHRTVFSKANQNSFPCLWVFAKNTFSTFPICIFLNVLNLWMKFSVEIHHHFGPLLFPLGNIIKILLYFCSEIVIHYILKMLY